MSITSTYLNRELHGGSCWNINCGKTKENYFWKIIFELNDKAREGRAQDDRDCKTRHEGMPYSSHFLEPSCKKDLVFTPNSAFITK